MFYNESGKIVKNNTGNLVEVPSQEEWLEAKQDAENYRKTISTYSFAPMDYDTACQMVNEILDKNKELKLKLKELQNG